MLWNELFTALALVLVVEGLLPFLKPERWRRVVNVMAKQSDHSLRIMGLVSMLLGVILLYAVH
jgi:uncharacterized protein YjeT (DUF2065 family)